MKNSVLDNFPPCPPAQAPPEKCKFYFYCRLAFSEGGKSPKIVPENARAGALQNQGAPESAPEGAFPCYFPRGPKDQNKSRFRARNSLSEEYELNM